MILGERKEKMEVERMIAPNFTQGFSSIKLKPSYMVELKKSIREVVLKGFGKFLKSYFSFIRLSKETNINHKHSSFLLPFICFSSPKQGEKLPSLSLFLPYPTFKAIPPFCRIRNQTQCSRHVWVVMDKNHPRWLESQIRYFVHAADSPCPIFLTLQMCMSCLGSVLYKFRV